MHTMILELERGDNDDQTSYYNENETDAKHYNEEDVGVLLIDFGPSSLLH